MRIKIFLLLLCINLFANPFNSKFLSSKEKNNDESTLTFTKEGGIYFMDEEAIKIGQFKLFSKIHSIKKIPIKIRNITKSNNLKHIKNSNIYIIFDRTNRYRLSDLKNNEVVLKKGLHKIHIEIKERRGNIKEGAAKINFDMKTN